MNRESGFQLSKAWNLILATIKSTNAKNARRNAHEEKGAAANQIPAGPR